MAMAAAAPAAAPLPREDPVVDLEVVSKAMSHLDIDSRVKFAVLGGLPFAARGGHEYQKEFMGLAGGVLAEALQRARDELERAHEEQAAVDADLELQRSRERQHLEELE